jgi:hypothetical protein
MRGFFIADMIHMKPRRADFYWTRKYEGEPTMRAIAVQYEI